MTAVPFITSLRIPERYISKSLDSPAAGVGQKSSAGGPKTLVVHMLAVLPCAALKAFVPGIFLAPPSQGGHSLPDPKK